MAECDSVQPDASAGKAYNVGGGPGNQLSLLQLLADLEQRYGITIRRTFSKTRPGDQPVFVADVRKAERELGWKPKTSISAGVGILADWVSANAALFPR